MPPQATVDQVSAITKAKIIPKLVDNIYEANPALEFLEKKSVKLDGGKRIEQPLLYAQNTSGGTYSGAEALDTSDNDIVTSAFFSWKQYYENISITGFDELVNDGAEAVLSLVQSKMKNIEKTMSDRLGTGVFSSGTDPKAILGTRCFLGTSLTYGGISQTLNSWWQSNTLTAATLAFADIRQALGAATVGNDKPDIGFATQTVYDIVWGLFQPQQRFGTEGKAGFAKLMVDDVPIQVDSHVPSGHLQFWNSDYLTLYVHSKRNFKMGKFIEMPNQDVRTAKLYWMGALASGNNRMHSLISGITG